MFHQVNDEAKLAEEDDGNVVLLMRHENQSMLVKVRVKG